MDDRSFQTGYPVHRRLRSSRPPARDGRIHVHTTEADDEGSETGGTRLHHACIHDLDILEYVLRTGTLLYDVQPLVRLRTKSRQEDDPSTSGRLNYKDDKRLDRLRPGYDRRCRHRARRGGHRDRTPVRS